MQVLIVRQILLRYVRCCRASDNSRTSNVAMIRVLFADSRNSNFINFSIQYCYCIAIIFQLSSMLNHINHLVSLQIRHLNVIEPEDVQLGSSAPVAVPSELMYCATPTDTAIEYCVSNGSGHVTVQVSINVAVEFNTPLEIPMTHSVKYCFR